MKVACLRLLVLLLSFFTSAVFAEPPRFVPDQIIVKLSSGGNEERMRQLMSRFGAQRVSALVGPELKESLGRMKGVKQAGRINRMRAEVRKMEDVYIVQLPAGADVEAIARALSRNPHVEYAKPNFILQAFETIPNDARFPEQYALYNTGQTGGVFDADIDATDAWDLNTGSAEVVVAILDIGVATYHEDLAQNIWVNTGEVAGNGVDDDNYCYTGSDGQTHCTVDDVKGWNFCNHSAVLDDNSFGHGTHVAGIVGAVGNNGVGISGVAWNVKLMPVQVLCPGFGVLLTNEVDVAAAMLYSIAHGADIINASWGGLGDRFTPEEVQLLYDAFSAADAAGVLSTIAAGNFPGQDNDVIPVYPANFDLPGIVTVAATDATDNLAYFSCFGATSVDIAAPGQDILSTTVDYARLGDSYGTMNGTSMAAPTVAGGAALVLSARPDLTHLEVKDVLLSSVDVHPSLDGRMVSGGRMNVHASVVNARALPLSIGGNVATPAGTTLRGMPLTIASQSGSTWGATTDQNGDYRSGLVLAHNTAYYVQLANRIYNTNPVGRFVSLQDDPEMNLNFVALPAISGYVRNASGAGIKGVEVKIANCCGRVWTVTTGTDGFYKSPSTLALNTAYYTSVSDSRYTAQPYGYFEQLGNDVPVTDRSFTATRK